MTKQEAIENHRKMWNWIADETERQKKWCIFKTDYFLSIGLNLFKSDEVLPNLCYCCAYAFSKCVDDCKACPIKWGETPDGEPLTCVSLESPYSSWSHSLSWKEAAKYAREIANLPERGDVQDEG